MPALTFTPSVLSLAVHLPVGATAYTPLTVRGHMPPATVGAKLTAGGGFAGVATLSKPGGEPWLTIPADCADGTAFDVAVDASALAPGSHTASIVASAAGFDDATCILTLAVYPGPA